MRPHFGILWFGLLAAFLSAFSFSAKADDKPPLPDQKDILSQLQKIGGKDWTVTAIPEGFLLTHVKPVIFTSQNSTASNDALNQQLAQGKNDKLSFKVIIGALPTAAELNRPNNPYSERPEAPIPDSMKAQLKRDHYALSNPSSWATGSQYSVYIVTNQPPDDNVFPADASASVDQLMFDLGALFHF